MKKNKLFMILVIYVITFTIFALDMNKVNDNPYESKMARKYYKNNDANNKYSEESNTEIINKFAR